VDLIADIGATRSRCALLDEGGAIQAPETFANRDFESLESLLVHYLGRRRGSDRPSRAALAVAAPITSDHVDMTNLQWSFSQIGLQVALGLRRLNVLNDFEALAWGLAEVDDAARARVGGGRAVQRATIGVLGPGSGLGVGGLVPCPEGWAALSGEGGHVTLAATTAEEVEICAALRERFEHCSAERVLSGPGLVNLYHALASLAGRGLPQIEPEDVTALAHKREPLAEKTLEVFFEFLGTVAADLAVTLGARGGIYIAGGIVPPLLAQLQASGFRERFEAKGRYRAYMRSIPTFVLTEETPAFRGLRRFLGFS
jgi:glucokinase